MRKVTCRCETSFDADLPEEIDLDGEGGASDGVLDEILNGDFLAVTCPNCGSLLKPELRVRLFSKKKGLDIVVLPELERGTLYSGTAGIPAGSEAIVGYVELYERARILADSLDPDAIEILKLWMIEKAEEQSPDGDISVSYAGKKGDKLAFHLSGLKEGEIAVLPIDPATYEKILADKAKRMREPPFDRVFKGPYRSVRILELDDSD
jgi:hypothetical protein